jgi:hypothetical protein
MSVSRPPATFMVLAALLLGCDAQAEGDGESGSESSGQDESGGEGDTDEPQECSFEPSDPFAGAQPQPLTLTNSGDTPKFVIPNSCQFLGIDVDGTDYRLGTRYECAGVPSSPPCYDGCDGGYLTPVIRVDPGASYDWPFSGFVFESASIPSICRPDCVEPEISSCGIGHVVEPGSMVAFTLRVASGCAGDPMCECPEGESACALDFEDYSESLENGSKAEVSVAFTHGSPDPVLVDLAQ